MFDEQRILLRATWHPARGFFNVSLWRDERVVETFHLDPDAAADLMAFFNRAFVSSLPLAGPGLRLVGADPAATAAGRPLAARWRGVLADAFDAAARRLRS